MRTGPAFDQRAQRHLRARSFHALDLVDARQQHFQRLRQAIAQTVDAMPDHGAFIDRHVKAAAMEVAA